VSDPRQELRELTAAFRAHLEGRARCGATGVSPRPSPPLGSAEEAAPVPAPSSPPPDGPDEPLTPYPTPPPVLYDEGQVAHSGRGLTYLRAEMGDCQRCKLAKTRRHIVFGTGNPEANLMFVGEAPGAEEDAEGEPFVGAAGQLLTKMIQAMGYDRRDVYICNVLKCRPPQNRNPEPDEIAACEQFLRKQIAILQPRVIVALGKFAAQFLCGEATPITRLRGNLRTFHEIPVMPTYHPAFLLREPARKSEAWSDLKQVMALLANMGLR
jgi:uracil-DNA glycosylase family 4